MNRNELNKEAYDFTVEWVSGQLPYGSEKTTTQLYEDFIDLLNDQKRKDGPSRSEFLSRLHKMEFLGWKKTKERGVKGTMKKWFKVEVQPDFLIEDTPISELKLSNLYDKAHEIYKKGREKFIWFR